ncbi:MAG: YfcE family phosphodiesterase [Planctomycetales bacterium]
MRIGIFADAHDHVDHVRRAVAEFNARRCELVVFAGDFVSPIVVPPLRKLTCRVLACFGDNEGNKPGIQGGMRIIGQVAEPPFCFRAADGTRILVTHQLEKVRDHLGDCEVVISAHAHRANIARDKQGRLFVNPGETSGWTYRKPSIAILDTATREAEIVPLPEMPPPVAIPEPG